MKRALVAESLGPRGTRRGFVALTIALELPITFEKTQRRAVNPKRIGPVNESGLRSDMRGVCQLSTTAKIEHPGIRSQYCDDS
jgi:hypothetical protein